MATGNHTKDQPEADTSSPRVGHTDGPRKADKL